MPLSPLRRAEILALVVGLAACSTEPQLADPAAAVEPSIRAAFPRISRTTYSNSRHLV